MAISYTLILTVAIFSNSYAPQPSSAIAVTGIPNFATYDDCMEAGKNARIPADRKWAETDKVYSCVKVTTS